MVTEIAELTVHSTLADAFPAAFTEAVTHLAGAKGFLGAQLNRGIESPERFVLTVQWNTLADHTEGFRTSEAFTKWRALVGPYFAEAPRVEHLELAATA